MQLTASFVAVVFGLAAHSAFAATCFPQSGCGKCANFQQVYVPPLSFHTLAPFLQLMILFRSYSQDLRTNFCNTKSGIANTPEQFNGYAHAQVFGGPIGDGDLCNRAFDNIVDQCFNHNDGGDFNYNGYVTAHPPNFNEPKYPLHKPEH
jgi:hypothetical protein